MPSRPIHLNEAQALMVDGLISSGGFRDQEEVIDAALALLARQRPKAPPTAAETDEAADLNSYLDAFEAPD